MQTDEPNITNLPQLRSQAEKKLLLKKKQNPIPHERDLDASKLLHELQVYQIELEMQNEELRKAYDKAEVALKKYTLVFEQAPMGFMTLKSDGSITELNYPAAEMLGERHFSLPGSNIKLFIDEASRIEFSNFLQLIYKTRSKESCRMFLANGQPLRRVYIEGIVIENDSQCMLSMIDISKFGGHV